MQIEISEDTSIIDRLKLMCVSLHERGRCNPTHDPERLKEDITQDQWDSIIKKDLKKIIHDNPEPVIDFLMKSYHNDAVFIHIIKDIIDDLENIISQEDRKANVH